jgi:transcriptional regulator with XRE-family HTH domain
MILVRHEIGDVLRDVRLQKGRTLRQVASRASVALGYLSEVERGQKRRQVKFSPPSQTRLTRQSLSS